VTALDPAEAKDMPALFPEELLIDRPLRAATTRGRFAVARIAEAKPIAVGSSGSPANGTSERAAFAPHAEHLACRC
jgi:hypothetical protein